MPTYLNTNSQFIVFTDGIQSITLGPNKTYKSHSTLINKNLKVIDESPFYNPFYRTEIFQGLKDTTHEFNIDPMKVGIIKITTNGQLQFYINSTNNEPPHIITSLYSFEIDAFRKIHKIILYCLSCSDVEIIFLKANERLL